MATSNQLKSFDVICGRNKASLNHIGNRRFRILIALSIQRYASAPTRAHKSAVIRDIVETIHSIGGRFLQENKKTGSSAWEELDDKQMYDKVGHALREMSTSYEEKSDVRKLLCPIPPMPVQGIPRSVVLDSKLIDDTSGKEDCTATPKATDWFTLTQSDDPCTVVTNVSGTDHGNEWLSCFDDDDWTQSGDISINSHSAMLISENI